MPSSSLRWMLVLATATGLACALPVPDGSSLPDGGSQGGSPDGGSSGSPDSGSGAPDSGSGAPDGGSGSPGGAWLHTSKNHIVRADDSVWHGRGANLPDTRSCNACAFEAPSVAEVERRIDELVDVWKANFIRLDLESYASAGGRVQWQTVLDDSAYLADVGKIVDYIGTKPGVYVMVTLWVDPSFSSMGWPQAGTNAELARLATTFLSAPQVIFGVCNEPQSNFDGSLDSQVWTAMNNAVTAIRQVEDAAGAPHHIVSVQGTGGWARRLDYYVSHPIAASGGENVAYEVHVYNVAADFPSLFETAAQTIPVIIGEYGPGQGMTESDVTAMLQVAENMEIPHLAWTFHMRCPPNLLQDNSGGGCGKGMALQPTSFGTLLKNRLATPW